MQKPVIEERAQSFQPAAAVDDNSREPKNVSNDENFCNGTVPQNSNREERTPLSSNRHQSFAGIDLMTFSDSSPDDTFSDARRKVKVERSLLENCYMQTSNVMRTEGSTSAFNLATPRLGNTQERCEDTSNVSLARSSPLQEEVERRLSYAVMRERLRRGVSSLKRMCEFVPERSVFIEVVKSNRMLTGVLNELLSQVALWTKAREKEKLEQRRVSDKLLDENKRLKDELNIMHEAFEELNDRYEACKSMLKGYQQNEEVMKKHIECSVNTDIDRMRQFMQERCATGHLPQNNC